jgi:hypothetical protein
VFLQMLSYFFQSISWKVVNLKFQQKNKNLIVYLKKRSLYVRTSLFVLFFTFYLFCSFGTCFRNLTADRHALGLQIKSRLQHSGKKNWKTSKTQKHSKKIERKADTVSSSWEVKISLCLEEKTKILWQAGFKSSFR